VLVAVLGVVVEGDVLSSLIELEIRPVGQALGEAWFVGKLVRESARLEHGLRVNASRLAQSGVQRKWRDSSTQAGSIRQLKKILLGLQFRFYERDIGGRSRGDFQCSVPACRLGGSGTICRGGHQAFGVVNGSDSRSEQEGKQ
jgi:hypothetical protein